MPRPARPAPRLVRTAVRTHATARRTTASSKPQSRAKPAAPSRRPAAEERLVGFPLQRVYDLHTWINDGKRVTKAWLARQWGVSRSTVKRDLAFMRTRLDMPLEWDEVRGSFIFTRPCEALPFLILTRREALVIALANHMCGGMFGASFGDAYESILRKIAPVLGSSVSRAVAAMQHVHAPPAVRRGPGEFDLLLPILDAIEGRRVLQFTYTKPGTTKAEKRVVHPLNIGLLDTLLRLTAYDPSRGDVRDFAFTRIQDLMPLDQIFERPEGFDARRRIETSAGAHAGGEVHDIRIALDALAASYARERPWHATQTLTPLPDGRTQLALRVSDLPGIKSRVLRWPGHAEILAPAALRDELRRDLQAALRQHSAASAD